MSKTKYPVTMGVRMLDKLGVEYGKHLYRWDKNRGARGAAEVLGVPPETVIKTLVFEASDGDPFIVLMDSTHDVSTKGMARHLGVKSVEPCDEKKAQSLTGYLIGGISPFGTRRPLPVHMEQGLLVHDTVYINVGKRGFLISLPPDEIRRVVNAEVVDVAVGEWVGVGQTIAVTRALHP